MRRLLVPGALLFAACAPAPSTPPATPAAVVISARRPALEPVDPGPPEEPRRAAPLRRYQEGPPPVAFPTPAACVLKASSWRGARPVTELRFRAGGPVFARVASGAASLHLPPGPAAEAGLELEFDGLVVRGLVAPEAVALHAAKPLVLGGLAIPTPRARLAWTGARPGELTVTHAPAAGVEVLAPPLTAPVRCDALSLDAVAFDPAAAAPEKKVDRPALLRLRRPISLSVDPAAAPAARLLARDDLDAEVTVIEIAGNKSRILWSRKEELIFGWVATSDLRPPNPGVGLGSVSTTGSGAGFGRSVHSVARVTCPADVPVIAEAEDERATVGLIRAGTLIHVMTRGGPESKIVVAPGGIQMATPAELLADAERLKDCAPEEP